jgi:hypothetical protein
MDISEARVIGALILLLGVSLLTVSIYTGHLNTVVNLLKTVFKPVGI